MEILNKKYLKRLISYEGLLRKEPLEYPEQALRETMLNAIIHKDYHGTTTFLSIYDNRLEIWIPGKLPDSLTIDQLKAKHRSVPRNRLIADVFFMAGYIEAWGRGIDIMIATKDLSDLVSRNLIQKLGTTGKGTKYVLS